MLTQWLKHIHNASSPEIVLGLERLYEMVALLSWKPPPCPVITVAGTNGKGSCVATLEKIYLMQGYRVGCFTSPILFRHNEMVRLQGKEASDQLFCDAYARIEQVRGKIALTPFEYHTLAALDIFRQQDLDVWILEVGLGGRLDAVNIIDADLAVIASIGIDHVEWLGNTRELIAREKAGIFRPGKPVVCGDSDPPASLLQQAQALAAPVYLQGRDFTYEVGKDHWCWQSKNTCYQQLPFSQLEIRNLSTALMAIELLQPTLPVQSAAIYQGINQVFLAGRIEKLDLPILHILDVAHNPAAVSLLAQALQKMPRKKKCRAVFSMLKDKDICQSIQNIQPEIDDWYSAPLAVHRGASVDKLQEAFQQAQVSNVRFYSSIEEAYQQALQASQIGDYLVVFGSFYTVAAIKPLAQRTSETGRSD